MKKKDENRNDKTDETKPKRIREMRKEDEARIKFKFPSRVI